jgi:hypothetical protein
MMRFESISTSPSSQTSEGAWTTGLIAAKLVELAKDRDRRCSNGRRAGAA